MFVNVDIFKISTPFREVDRSSILRIAYPKKDLLICSLITCYLNICFLFIVFTVNINYLETSIPVLSL